MMPWAKRAMAHGLVASAAALGLPAAPASASSEFVQGRFVQNAPGDEAYDGRGVCRFVTGPREGLGQGKFELTAGGEEEARAVRLRGSFTVVEASGGRSFALTPDKDAAEAYVENVLRKQLGDKAADFRLDALEAAVRETRFGLTCSVGLTGRLSGTDMRPTKVGFSFENQGLYDPGSVAPATANAAQGRRAATSLPATSQAADMCPTQDPKNLNASLAPLGLAPVPAQCGTQQCLVDFKGYKWWTSFQYYGGPGGFFPGGGYFYNDGLQTPFAPKNAFVDSAGLHLKIATQDLGGGPTTAGSEVVLMFRADGSEANLGYGDYLVTAKVKSAASWATLDPNVAFGAFTFERVGTGSTGPATNPHREIDLAEISRWGWDHSGVCPLKGSSSPLCEGNAQFTLQPWESNAKNLHRYTIKDKVAAITLVMKWHGEGQPVTFEQYNGAFGFANLPAAPDTQWQSSPDQNRFIPATKCERFHLNLWLGNYSAGQKPNPPPKTLPQEIVVTNFQFRPFR